MHRLAFTLCLAASTVGCAETRGGLADAVTFIDRAGTLSARPVSAGPYPSPYAGPDVSRRPPLLPPGERTAALDALKAAGAASEAEARNEAARLKAASPYE